jgi:hypothetical protein
MNRFLDPFAMLVGRVGQNGATLMAPPGRPPYAPPGGGCGPSYCPPLDVCPPQGPAFYGQAARSAIAAQGPQTALGINSRDQSPGTPIIAGGTRTISATPTVPFCISKLIVARTSAPFFGIGSIKAARTEYLTDGEFIPADVFAPDTTSPPQRMPMLYPGSSVSMLVRNQDTADHHFDATFMGFPGPSCEPCL